MGFIFVLNVPSVFPVPAVFPSLPIVFSSPQISDLTLEPLFPRPHDGAFFGNTEPACRFPWGNTLFSYLCDSCFRHCPCTLRLPTPTSPGAWMHALKASICRGTEEMSRMSLHIFCDLPSRPYHLLFPLPTTLFKLTAFEGLVGPGKEVLDFRMLCDNPVIAASMSPCASLPLWHPSSTCSSGRTVSITLRDNTWSSVSVSLLVPKEVFVITELSLSLWCRCPRCLAGVFHNLHLGCSYFIVHWRVSLL